MRHRIPNEEIRVRTLTSVFFITPLVFVEKDCNLADGMHPFFLFEAQKSSLLGKLFFFLVPIGPPVHFEGVEKRNFFFWTGDKVNSNHVFAVQYGTGTDCSAK